MSNDNNNVPLPRFELYVKGQRVEFVSAFPTLDDAAQYLRTSPAGRSTFASDLLSKKRLSEAQAAWVHKLATDAARPRGDASRVVPGSALDLRPVVELLESAHAKGRQWPRLTLSVGGQPVVLSLAGQGSKTPGAVNLTDGRPFGQNVWFGRIHPQGGVVKGSAWTDAVQQLLVALAAKPATVIGQHGLSTGRCSICGLPLTNAASRTAGYGPVCAENYGLPWGDTRAADAADAAGKAAGASLVPTGPTRAELQAEHQDNAFAALQADEAAARGDSDPSVDSLFAGL